MLSEERIRERKNEIKAIRQELAMEYRKISELISPFMGNCISLSNKKTDIYIDIVRISIEINALNFVLEEEPDYFVENFE